MCVNIGIILESSRHFKQYMLNNCYFRPGPGQSIMFSFHETLKFNYF